jgi:hypothetical protein
MSNSFPDVGSAPEAAMAEEIRHALEGLLADVRQLYDDDRPERMIQCQHTVAKVRRARAALEVGEL